MSVQIQGVSASPTGLSSSMEPVPVSTLRASIPDAAPIPIGRLRRIEQAYAKQQASDDQGVRDHWAEILRLECNGLFAALAAIGIDPDNLRKGLS